MGNENAVPATARHLRSLVEPGGRVRVSIVDAPVVPPGPDEVIVRVEAAPINPSDLGTVFAGADLATVAPAPGPPAASDGDGPAITAELAPAAQRAAAGRVGRPLPAGNEGAGVVVAAGSSPVAQALLGRTVAMFGGAMYAEYRTIGAEQCLVLHEGTDARDGASCFVNPLTALGMVETMRREGHRALVHTAAASNLGQMLQRICLADGVPLVNIVRKPAQVELLRAAGATQVCDTSRPAFGDELTDALAATKATIGFDAAGGGPLAGQILACMEAAVLRGEQGAFNRYGSSVHKQVYLYGNLDKGPTELVRSFGMAWSIGGWLLMPFLAQAGPEVTQRLRRRVVDELHSTFASSYTKEIPLAAMLHPEEIAVYGKQATGEKYLVRPAAGS